MAWRKLGVIFNTGGEAPWSLSHASYPTATLLDDDRLRVFFTALDANQYGQGGYVDLDPCNPTRVLGHSRKPVLRLGEIGDFDDAGANPFSVVEFDGRRLMYYVGWQRTQRAPYQLFTGLAFEEENGQFRKWARVPVLDRTHEEPHMRSAPCVLREGRGLRMWYIGSNRWTSRNGMLHYHVSIRHAVSQDGVAWRLDPHVCLQPGHGEYAVGRPSVIRENGRYRMWYSIRSFERPYALGYAESDDGVRWMRKDEEAGVRRSEEGWDSQMVCFPNVIRAGGQLLLFYNGNGHGATGFGAAVWED